MSFDRLICCGQKILAGNLWILQDIKNFTKRKLYMTTCPKCGDDVILLTETRISDNQTFFNVFRGLEAVKTMHRENKRKLTVIPLIQTDALFGWVYGLNTQLKDKKGNITKIRQYSKSLKGNQKLLVKEICL